MQDLVQILQVLQEKHLQDLHIPCKTFLLSSDIVRRLLVRLACLGLWLALLGLIARPSGPNEGYGPPTASQPLPRPAQPPSSPPQTLCGKSRSNSSSYSYIVLAS